jgi:hypothetical protein
MLIRRGGQHDNALLKHPLFIKNYLDILTRFALIRHKALGSKAGIRVSIVNAPKMWPVKLHKIEF